MKAARLLPCADAMDQPKEPRPPVNLRIKFRSASLEQFIERYAGDVSRGGIFIRTREPLAVGTELRLDFKLQEGQQLLTGEGTVVWVREPDPGRPQALPGMGVRFDELSVESRETLDHILTEKAKREQHGPTAARAVESAGMAVRRPSSSFSAIEAQVPPKKDDAVPTASAAPNTAPVDLTGPTTTASAINYRALVASSARPATLPPGSTATEAAPKTLPEGAAVPPAPTLGVPKPFIAGTPPTGQEKVELPSANEVDEAFAGMVNDSGPSRLAATPTPPAGQPALARGGGTSDSYRAPAFRTGRRITGSVAIAPPEAAPKSVDEPSSEPTLIADTPEALLAAATKGKAVPTDDQPTPGPEMLAALDLFGRPGRAPESPSEPVLDEATAPGALDRPPPGITAPSPRLSLPPSAFGGAAGPAEPTSLRDTEPPPTASGSFTNAKAATPEIPGPKSAVIVEAQRGGSAQRPRKSKAPLIGALVAAAGVAALVAWQLGFLGGPPRSASLTPGPAPAPSPAAPATPENGPAPGTPSPSDQAASASPGTSHEEGAAGTPAAASAGAADKGDKSDKPANAMAHQLRIITTPTGAQISIDGKPVGRSPYVDKTFDVSGMHTVGASKEGFETWEMSVSAEDEWQEVKTAKGSALAELVLKPKLKKNTVAAAPRARPKPAPKPSNPSPTEAPLGNSVEPPKLDAERSTEGVVPKEEKAEKPAEKAEKAERADKPEKASDKPPKAAADKPEKTEKTEKTGEKDAPLPPN